MFRDVITTEQTFSGNVLRALANGSKTGAEIAQELKLEKNGRTASVLARLVEAGLVSADVCLNPETGKKAREIRYRLKDNYSRFYLKYIEPMKSIIDAGAFDLVTLEALEGIDAVMGLAFENLVVNNYRELLNALNLNGTIITSAAPYRRNASNGKRKGCQIDLLIQARRSLIVVEIKRRKEIGRDVIDEVDEKVKALVRPDGVSIRTALVYDGHLSPLVAADGYFYAIIPFRTLLE
jgi:hypothetical protein